MFDVKWNEEADGVIGDIKPFVKSIHICVKQPNLDQMVLFNLETFENEKFCIKLCVNGFGVIGRNFDLEDAADVEKWYETPYAMLADISKSYVERFELALVDKLSCLRDD